MAIIDTSVLLGICDRAAAQYGLVKVAFDSINATGTGFYWQRITATDDVDVEIPMLSPGYSSDTTLTLATCVRSGCPALGQVVTMTDSHFSRVAHTGGLDTFLTTGDERVSDYYNQVYYLAKGSYLLANNVFSEDSDDFGRIDIHDSLTLTFTDGTNYGNGAAANKADGSHFASTQLRMYVVYAGGGGDTLDDIDLTLSVKDKNNSATTVTVTIPTGTSPGDYVSVGTSISRYLDVTDAAFTNLDDKGTDGDILRIYNLKERSVVM